MIDRSHVRIALVADSHLAPQAAAFNANWLAVRQYVARSGIDLTVHLGDITVDGAADRTQFDWALQLCADWPSPIRFVPGNHDIGDNPPGPGVVSKHPLNVQRLEQYRQSFGPDYWMLDTAGWRLIGLNAQLFGAGTQEEERQWIWIEDALGRADAQPTILLLHKPVFQDGPEDAEPRIRYLPIAPRRQLLGLLDKADVRAALCGHTHQYLDRRLAGRRYVWLPSTAFWLPDSIQERVGEKVTGVGVLELSPGECRLDLVCPEGVARNNLLDHPIYPGIAATAARAAIQDG